MYTHKELRRKLQGRYSCMKRHCHDPLHKDYHKYGGRGITVCAEWIYGGSDAFTEWALSNGFRPELCLSLIDKHGVYSPANCKWIPKLQINKERRFQVMVEYQGQHRSLIDVIYSVHPGCSPQHYGNISNRITQGWDVELALTKPIRTRAPRNPNNVNRVRSSSLKYMS